jgi:hypothetical protein
MTTLWQLMFLSGYVLSLFGQLGGIGLMLWVHAMGTYKDVTESQEVPRGA